MSCTKKIPSGAKDDEGAGRNYDMNKFVEPNADHVAWDYLVFLHREIASYRTQVRVLHQEYRFKKIKDLKINEVSVTLEDLRWALHILYNSDQAPHFDKAVFKRTEKAIWTAVDNTEKFLEKLQERVRGVKIPERPPEVDEWMKRTG